MPLTKKEQDKINLCGTHELTQEERRAGGIASAQKRKELKTMRELANIVNGLPSHGKGKTEILAQYGDDLKAEEINKQMVFIFRVYSEAMAGNVKAMKLWIDLSDDLNAKRKELEVEKLQAEVDELKREADRSDASNVSVNIEIRDCKS